MPFLGNPKYMDLKDLSDEENIKKRQRNTRWLSFFFFAVICAGLVVLGIIANSGRLASVDNSESTSTQLTNNLRAACVSDRRSIQVNAQSDELEAQHKALSATIRAIAASYLKDTNEVKHQIDVGQDAIEEGDNAVKREHAARERLEPEALNLTVKEGGCGPPVVNRKQVHN